ncbi:Hypothetical protein (plasmid) [Pseudomonas putida]|nr:Hypothetical protein [Pseudomonas putida]
MRAPAGYPTLSYAWRLEPILMASTADGPSHLAALKVEGRKLDLNAASEPQDSKPL